MGKSLALFFALLFAAGSALAGELPVGPVLFKLGSPQESVLTVARANFNLISVSGNPDMFFLASKNDPNSKVLGGISFKAGRLAWVQRNWGNFSGTASAIDVAKAIQSALASAVSATDAQASITIDQKQVPGTEFRSMYFQFPGRRVNVSVADSSEQSYGKQVTVDESVSL